MSTKPPPPPLLSRGLIRPNKTLEQLRYDLPASSPRTPTPWERNHRLKSRKRRVLNVLVLAFCGWISWRYFRRRSDDFWSFLLTVGVGALVLRRVYTLLPWVDVEVTERVWNWVRKWGLKCLRFGGRVCVFVVEILPASFAVIGAWGRGERMGVPRGTQVERWMWWFWGDVPGPVGAEPRVQQQQQQQQSHGTWKQHGEFVATRYSCDFVSSKALRTLGIPYLPGTSPDWVLVLERLDGEVERKVRAMTRELRMKGRKGRTWWRAVWDEEGREVGGNWEEGSDSPSASRTHATGTGRFGREPVDGTKKKNRNPLAPKREGEYERPIFSPPIRGESSTRESNRPPPHETLPGQRRGSRPSPLRPQQDQPNGSNPNPAFNKGNPTKQTNSTPPTGRQAKVSDQADDDDSISTPSPRSTASSQSTAPSTRSSNSPTTPPPPRPPAVSPRLSPPPMFPILRPPPELSMEAPRASKPLLRSLAVKVSNLRDDCIELWSTYAALLTAQDQPINLLAQSQRLLQQTDALTETLERIFNVHPRLSLSSYQANVEAMELDLDDIKGLLQILRQALDSENPAWEVIRRARAKVYGIVRGVAEVLGKEFGGLDEWVCDSRRERLRGLLPGWDIGDEESSRAGEEWWKREREARYLAAREREEAERGERERGERERAERERERVERERMERIEREREMAERERQEKEKQEKEKQEKEKQEKEKESADENAQKVTGGPMDTEPTDPNSTKPAAQPNNNDNTTNNPNQGPSSGITGPPAYKAALRTRLQQGFLPTCTNASSYLCGIRALIISLENMHELRPGSMRPRDLLSRMFINPAIDPDFDIDRFREGQKGEPTDEYRNFLEYQIGQFGLQDPSSVDREFNSALSMHNFASTQLSYMLKLMDHYGFLRNAGDLALGIVTKALVGGQATVQIHSATDLIDHDRVVWVFNDNAAERTGGIGHWSGFAQNSVDARHWGPEVQSWGLDLLDENTGQGNNNSSAGGSSGGAGNNNPPNTNNSGPSQGGPPNQSPQAANNAELQRLEVLLQDYTATFNDYQTRAVIDRLVINQMINVVEYEFLPQVQHIREIGTRDERRGVIETKNMLEDAAAVLVDDIRDFWASREGEFGEGGRGDDEDRDGHDGDDEDDDEDDEILEIERGGFVQSGGFGGFGKGDRGRRGYDETSDLPPGARRGNGGGDSRIRGGGRGGHDRDRGNTERNGGDRRQTRSESRNSRSGNRESDGYDSSGGGYQGRSRGGRGGRGRGRGRGGNDSGRSRSEEPPRQGNEENTGYRGRGGGRGGYNGSNNQRGDNRGQAEGRGGRDNNANTRFQPGNNSGDRNGTHFNGYRERSSSGRRNVNGNGNSQVEPEFGNSSRGGPRSGRGAGRGHQESRGRQGRR